MARKEQMTHAAVTERAGTAREHLQVAEERLLYAATGTGGPSAEAQVAASNAISAGIAASDAICGKVLGERANDNDHRAAVDYLSRVEPGGRRLSAQLNRLLADKSLHQYGGYVTYAKARKATDQAMTLVAAMSTFGIR